MTADEYATLAILLARACDEHNVNWATPDDAGEWAAEARADEAVA